MAAERVDAPRLAVAAVAAASVALPSETTVMVAATVGGATVAVTAEGEMPSVPATAAGSTVGAAMGAVEVVSMVCVISNEAEACRRRAARRRRPEEVASATEQLVGVKPAHTSASRAMRICAAVTPAGRGVLTAAVCSRTTSTFSAWSSSPPVAALERVASSVAGSVEPRSARLSDTSEVRATLKGGKGGGDDGGGGGDGGDGGGGEKRWPTGGTGGGGGDGGDGGGGEGWRGPQSLQSVPSVQ